MIRRYLFVCALFAAACTLSADTFRIGEADIVIPAPQQSVRVTPQMPLLQKLFDQMEDPVNNTLAAYVSPVVAEAGLKGELPRLGNYFLLKVNKQLVEPVVSAEEFNELREVLLSQQERALEALRERMPDLVNHIERNVLEAFGAEISLQIGEVLPLGVYSNEANMLGFSLLMKLAGANDADAVTLITSCVLLNVSGKVVFLYAYGSQKELVWTREYSTAWANAILSANAPAPTKAEGKGIDLSRVLIAGLAGCLIGGGVALFGIFRAKRRSRAE